MKKFKLNVRVRQGMLEKHIEDIELDTIHFTEFVRMKELLVYNPEAYLVFSLEELPEPEEVEN